MNPEFSSGGYKNRHFPLLSKSVESAVLPGLASERQPLCRTGKSTRDWRGCKMEERHYVFPKQEILERYIRVIAKHAGKRIMPYEICNEPGCAISPEHCMNLIFRPVSAVLRRENPEAAVIGVCSTSDKGYQLGKFLQECLKRNVQENSDVISFHPCGSQELSPPEPADKPRYVRSSGRRGIRKSGSASMTKRIPERRVRAKCENRIPLNFSSMPPRAFCRKTMRRHISRQHSGCSSCRVLPEGNRHGNKNQRCRRFLRCKPQLPAV